VTIYRSLCVPEMSVYYYYYYYIIIIENCTVNKNGCHISVLYVSIFVYADDIVLIAPTIDALHRLLILLENQLDCIDMRHHKILVYSFLS